MKEIKEIKDILEQLSDKDAKSKVTLGILINLAFFLVAIFLFFFANNISDDYSSFGLVIFFVLLGTQLILLLYFVFRPLVFRRSEMNVAKVVDHSDGLFADRLTAALELSDLGRIDKEGYSKSFVKATVRQAYDLLKKFTVSDAMHQGILGANNKLLFWGRAVFASAAFVLLFVVLLPSDFYYTLKKYSNLYGLYDLNDAGRIKVFPGNVSVSRGDSVEIKIYPFSNGNQTTMILRWRKQNNVWEEQPLGGNLIGRNYSYQFRNVDGDIEYYAFNDGSESEVYYVTLIDNPRITRLKLKYSYPGYTRLEPKEVFGTGGDIETLVGTKVSLVGRATNKLTDAKLEFDSGERISTKLEGERGFGVEFRVFKNDTYRISLSDINGLVNTTAYEYAIRVIPDDFPQVEIVSPGHDELLNEDMFQPLVIDTSDDFGISKLVLASQKTSSFGEQSPEELETIKIFSDQPDEILLQYPWDLSKENLLPGDVMSYYVLAHDNDTISGPKISKSKTYTLRFPTLEEIFKSAETAQEEVVKGIEEVYKESEDLKRHLQELSRELDKENELSWEDQKQAEGIVKKQEELSKKLDSVKKKLDEALENLQENEVIDPAIIKKIQEVRKLLEEVATPEMLEAMKKIQDAIEKMDPEDLKKALEQFKLSQEEYLKQLDRSIAALKKLKLEQKLDSLTKQAEGLLQKEKQLKDDTDQASSDRQMEQLAKKQEEIKNDTEGLFNEMQEASDMLRENSEDEFSQDMNGLYKQMQEKGLAQTMKQISGSLSQGERTRAQQGEEQAVGDLSELAEGLEKLQEGLREKWQDKTRQALEKAVSDLLYLSKRQEELAQKLSEESGHFDPSQLEFAKEEMNLLNSMKMVADELGKAARESFFLSREVGAALGKALAQMNSLTLGLQEGGQSSRSMASKGVGAYGALNEATLKLMQDLAAMQSSSSGIGIDIAFQRLQQMAQQQQGINQGMGQLLPQFGEQSGGLTPGGKQALRKLAAEQKAVQEGLEELNEGLGDRSDMLGRLGELADEVGEIVEEMERMGVSQKTLERQRKILQRLLDAQKSVQRRDISKKRKSEVAKEYKVINPGALPGEVFEKNKNDLEDYLKEWEGKYPEEYRKLIESYFKALRDAGIGHK